MNDCIAQCGIRHVLTSRRVMERFDLKLDAELVFLEDFMDKITLADKLLRSPPRGLLPSRCLERRLGLTAVQPDDLLTIIFTSGSTGRPKGVMLTHRNVGSNVEAVDQIIRLGEDDVLLGILPFFHSFGYTITLWTVLDADAEGHLPLFSPLEAREVGKLCRKHGATIMSPRRRSCDRTCGGASRRISPAGRGLHRRGEAAPELADAFEKRSASGRSKATAPRSFRRSSRPTFRPAARRAGQSKACKEGTVGRPLPGISAKVVDLDTGEDLGPNQSGMLLVTGPNVMKGYFGRPDLTAEVIRDGWYVTGDVAEIDDDGFINITGRISRFSKIAGEMVPHIRIEEAIGQVLQLDEGRNPSSWSRPCPTRRRANGWSCCTPAYRIRRKKSAAAGRSRPAAALDSLARQFPPSRRFRSWAPASSTLRA